MSCVLEKLFNSKSRVKMLRFFLRNQENWYCLSEIARRNKISAETAKSEIKVFESIGFIAAGKKEDDQNDHSQEEAKEKKQILDKDCKDYYRLNSDFKLLKELEALVFAAGFISKEELANIIDDIGKVKLAVISGVFLGENSPIRHGRNRVDLFLVVDAVDKQKLKNTLQNIEAEIGKEIDYSVLTTEEFGYRRDMYDKFVHDVLDGPREDLINRLKV